MAVTLVHWIHKRQVYFRTLEDFLVNGAVNLSKMDDAAFRGQEALRFWHTVRTTAKLLPVVGDCVPKIHGEDFVL